MEKPNEYYAVIFSSVRAEGYDEEYSEMAALMEELASKQGGFVGIESARGSDGFGITVSYWKSEACIRNWRTNVEHMAAQKLGREQWYQSYSIRIARVNREYHYET